MHNSIRNSDLVISEITLGTELGLVAGTPVGTSLIDAHAGSVGVMESVPVTDSGSALFQQIGKSAFHDLKFPIGTEAKTIVLIGRTGNGKSATGNSIIGANVFDSMPSLGGVTATCQMHWTVLDDGQILNVIDTPGLGNEIAKCINMEKNGIHAVLVVVSLGTRFSQEEASAIKRFKQFFGGLLSN